MMKATLALSSGYKCGCISRTSEHCRMNPFQSSTRPVKGAGLAMGLAIADGEGDAAVNAEVVAEGAGGAGVEVLGSWKQAGVEQTRHEDTHRRRGDTRSHMEHWIQVCGAEAAQAHAFTYDTFEVRN
ncbi:hypothetical protein DPX16_13894 [Anabarilius grahami]|uniref:Uncharacterized protein n=1 Tax=Anabarilius grahami TaxID=495550 RepID=A0A3N0XVM4_ANAGA|nr:hypothetical protein DPX16_13894 [Anabarilius grahami]